MKVDDNTESKQKVDNVSKDNKEDNKKEDEFMN